MATRCFKKGRDDVGANDGWQNVIPADTLPMPVPAAFNEMASDPELRDFAGITEYYREFDADAVAGMRSDPPIMLSDESQ
jgi:hypothetical protein